MKKIPLEYSDIVEFKTKNGDEYQGGVIKVGTKYLTIEMKHSFGLWADYRVPFSEITVKEDGTLDVRESENTFYSMPHPKDERWKVGKRWKK